MLFLGPGELSRIMRVEVFNSALQNDRSLRPQHDATTYSLFAIQSTTDPQTNGSRVWPPTNTAAFQGRNVTRLCHVLINFDASIAAYYGAGRASRIFPVVWNEWWVAWYVLPLLWSHQHPLLQDNAMGTVSRGCVCGL